MGVDFVSGKAKHFTKGWDREAVALGCPDLFKPQPEAKRRLIEGELVAGAHVEIGDVLIARLTDGGLAAYRMEVPIVRFEAPPAKVLAAVQEGCGVAEATIEEVGELSGTVKVLLK
jgi:hypothetical protein